MGFLAETLKPAVTQEPEPRPELLKWTRQTNSPASPKVIISDGGSGGVESPVPRLSSRISTVLSLVTWPKCSFLMALSRAARGTGCVRFGRAFRCSMLRMWCFTASTMSLWLPYADEFLLVRGREQSEDERQSEDGSTSSWRDGATASREETAGEASTKKIMDTVKKMANWGHMTPLNGPGHRKNRSESNWAASHQAEELLPVKLILIS